MIVVAMLAFALVAGTYRAPSQSMVPTLNVGSRFTVLKFGGDEMCGGGAPPEGQMCAKPTARKAAVKFVKRVVETWLVGRLWFVSKN